MSNRDSDRDYPSLSILPFEQRALRAQIGGLASARKRLKNKPLTPELQTRIEIIEEREAAARRRKIGLQGPPEPEPEPVYVEVEYVKYYRYLGSGNKARHFEARVIMTIPDYLDPGSDNVFRVVSNLLDDGMSALDIETEEGWDTGWKTGGEPTGTTTNRYDSRPNVTVTDRLRPRQGPWNTSVPTSENDF